MLPAKFELFGVFSGSNADVSIKMTPVGQPKIIISQAQPPKIDFIAFGMLIVDSFSHRT